MNWLNEEAYDLSENTVDHIDILRDLGIDAAAVIKSCPLGLTRCRLSGEFWEPSEKGVEALTVPVFSADGVMVDLLAMSIDNAQCWRRTGFADDVLCEGAIQRASITGKPLFVYSSLLEWVRFCRNGAVVIDWRTYLPLYFSGIDRIVCTNPRTSAMLRDKLRQQARMPKIVVTECNA